MIEFLNAKATSYKITMSWIGQELKELHSLRPKHGELIDLLQTKLDECEVLRNQLEIIMKLGHPSLVNRALPIIHDIEFWIIVITAYYLPALRREDDKDTAIKNILSSTAARCGLSWIKDFAVRLDGPLATVSAITEIPVVFSFPQHSISLLNMAGLYHELAHNVFRRFPIIADHLTATVSDYFSDFRRQAGPLGPSEKAERDRAINAAQRYWDSKRLDELFADIFAVFVCGPAYYVSCVDMAVSLDSKPFEVNFMDEHPPAAARVLVSHNALSSIHSQEPSVILASNFHICHHRTPPGDTECYEAIWSRGSSCKDCAITCYRQGWDKQRVTQDNKNLVRFKKLGIINNSFPHWFEEVCNKLKEIEGE